MRTVKSLQLAWNMLTNSKLRSWLTIIGIVIGIGAVIAIMAISEGAQSSMEESIGDIGADIITITPGMSRAGRGGPEMMGGGATSDDDDSENLTSKDILALKTVSNVKYVMGTVSGEGTIKYEGKSTDKNINGIETDYMEEFITTDLSEGRFLQKSDINSVVIGYDFANSVFDGIELNRKIEIEGKQFRVVGILESGNDVYMPIDRARIVLEDVGNEEFDSISVMVEDAELLENTTEDITEKLMAARGILKDEDRDFSVSSNQDMQESMSEMLESMTLFLSAIAAISLLVGAVGIANTMFTSVLEKTKEIGIMKAVGAKNKDIMSIFLFNAGMIGLTGGIGGVILGSVVASIIGNMSGITTSTTGGGPRGGIMGMFSGGAIVSWQLVVGAFLFSIIIGMISGLIPAYRASRLKPVDALRHE